MRRTAAVILSTTILFSAGCRSSGGDGANATGILIDLDRSDEQPYLEYYLTPFGSGMFEESGGRFYLQLERLISVDGRAKMLEPAAGDGLLTWDELKPFLAETYYDLVGAPATLIDLLEASEAGSALDVDDWMEIEVEGVMTNALRHVFVPTAAVREAVDNYVTNGSEIRYPVGTTFVADHVFEGDLVETTAMRRREDGYWDYFVFGSDGRLVDSTATPPKSLAAPTQCSGCHLGTRLFEPEKSFPGVARPGPDGPRTVHVDGRHRNSTVARYLDEHRKRSDGVLGLYATVFLSELIASRQDGTIDPDDSQLLEQLGL